mmetsp:Transcript_114283/g.328310  ORF Transcript_114283/g.328310 Transcript_114283/m.328310 type:complete len:342 (+) Transcript_114283:1918-2943(+)
MGERQPRPLRDHGEDAHVHHPRPPARGAGAVQRLHLRLPGPPDPVGAHRRGHPKPRGAEEGGAARLRDEDLERHAGHLDKGLELEGCFQVRRRQPAPATLASSCRGRARSTRLRRGGEGVRQVRELPRYPIGQAIAAAGRQGEAKGRGGRVLPALRRGGVALPRDRPQGLGHRPACSLGRLVPRHTARPWRQRGPPAAGVERDRRLLRGPRQVEQRRAVLHEGQKQRRPRRHVLLPRGVRRAGAAHPTASRGQPAAEGHRRQVQPRGPLRAVRQGLPQTRGCQAGRRHLRDAESVGPGGEPRPAAKLPGHRGLVGEIRPAPSGQEQENRGRPAVQEGKPPH